MKREELFITSKLWNDSHKPELVEKALDETLEQLGIDYLDLYCENSRRTVVLGLTYASNPLAGVVPSWEGSFPSPSI